MDRPDRDRGRGLRPAGGVLTTAAGVAALLAIWLLPAAAPVEARLAVCAGAAVWALGGEAFGTAVMVIMIGVMASMFGALVAVQLFRLRRIRKAAPQ